MGILSKLFTRKLTEQEKEEKSRREKEWAEKCYNKGEQFAQKISLDKPIAKLNLFANKYPRTFFAVLLGLVIGFNALNFFMANPSTNIAKDVETLQTLEIVSNHEDPRGIILNEMMQMAENLKTLDKKIEAFQAKDSLTTQDSIQLRTLLMQAEALNNLLRGRQKSLTEDTVNINK